MESRVCQDIYRRAYDKNPFVPKEDLIVFMGLSWSDNFSPNSSINENRGAAWVNKLTLVSTTFSHNIVEDTYPISI